MDLKLDRQVSFESGKAWATENRMPFYEISAFDEVSVQKVFSDQVEAQISKR